MSSARGRWGEARGSMSCVRLMSYTSELAPGAGKAESVLEFTASGGGVICVQNS